MLRDLAYFSFRIGVSVLKQSRRSRSVLEDKSGLFRLLTRRCWIVEIVVDGTPNIRESNTRGKAAVLSAPI